MGATTERIGTAMPRIDAFAKVTGREKYAADYYSEAFLWAGVKRAGIPHGRITKIAVDDAFQVKGVMAVLTHRDIPGPNRVGVVRKDEPVLADLKVRRPGDALALVIAESRDALGEAVRAVTFDYDPLPGVFDAEEALKPGAPLVHEDNSGGNLLRKVLVEKGWGERAFDECAVIVKGTFEVPRQEHAYLETEAGWAYCEDGGKIVIVASTQTPFRDRTEIAWALGLDVERIRVVAPYLGGAFGGKDGITVQCLLAVAAMRSKGRPVKMWWDREESFLAGNKRLPARMHYRLGAKGDGTFHALECSLTFDTGAYASLGGEVMTLAAEHAGSAYRIPHVKIEGACVYTNNPVGGPFRGFGVPQVTAAMEQMVDIIAGKLGMDPLQIRMLNALERGDSNCIGVTLRYSAALRQCLEALGDNPLWKGRTEWKKSAGPFKARGVGMACMAHAMGYPAVVPDFANAKVELTGEGKVRVYAGVSDMGQGNASTAAQIAASLLEQDISSVEVQLPDTEKTLPCGSASASRCTYVYGNALLEAVASLKRRILEEAALLLGRPDVTGLALIHGGVNDSLSGRNIGLNEIAESLGETGCTCTGYFRAPAATGEIDRIYLGPHLLYSYGAQAAFVEIDRLTGRIEVKHYLAVTDAGSVINPQIYEQQIQGSIAQGLGYALSEEYRVVEGQAQTADLSTYIIPTSLDMPEMVSVPVEVAEETGPFGLKGVGEIAISGVMPSIANAVADAGSARIYTSPFKGEKVLQALKDTPEQG